MLVGSHVVTFFTLTLRSAAPYPQPSVLSEIRGQIIPVEGK